MEGGAKQGMTGMDHLPSSMRGDEVGPNVVGGQLRQPLWTANKIFEVEID